MFRKIKGKTQKTNTGVTKTEKTINIGRKEYPVSHLYVARCENYYELYEGLELVYPRVDCFLLMVSSVNDIEPGKSDKVKKLSGINAGTILKAERTGNFAAHITEFVDNVENDYKFNVNAIFCAKFKKQLLERGVDFQKSFFPNEELIAKDIIEDLVEKYNKQERDNAISNAKYSRSVQELIDIHFSGDKTDIKYTQYGVPTNCYPVRNLFVGKCSNYTETINGLMCEYPRYDIFLLKNDTVYIGHKLDEVINLTGDNMGMVMQGQYLGNSVWIPKECNGNQKGYYIEGGAMVRTALSTLGYVLTNELYSKDFVSLDVLQKINEAKNSEARIAAYKVAKTNNIIEAEFGEEE